MRQSSGRGIVLLTLGLAASLWSAGQGLYSQPPALPSSVLELGRDISYQKINLPGSVVHTVFIPPGAPFRVTPAYSEQLESLEGFARKHQATAVLNAGYFDPKNGKTTSYVTLESKQVGDPRRNERLTDNPALAPYLEKIFNRSEFRSYACGNNTQYDIVPHDSPVPTGCQLVDAVGAGPLVYPRETATEEGFLDSRNGKVIRDPIGVNGPNARSAVAIAQNGGVILMMAAQKPDAPTRSGLAFSEMKGLFQSLGVRKAMALDGGSSSALYVEGKTLYGKLDAKGNPVQRKVKSALLVKPLG